MAKKTKQKIESCGPAKLRSNGAAGGLYGLGFIGALVYYIQSATSYWGAFVGVLKAIVWPAFLVYNLMTFLKP